MPSLTCPQCGRIFPSDISPQASGHLRPGTWFYGSPTALNDHWRGYFLVVAPLAGIGMVIGRNKALAAFLLLITLAVTAYLYFGLRKPARAPRPCDECSIPGLAKASYMEMQGPAH